MTRLITASIPLPRAVSSLELMGSQAAWWWTRHLRIEDVEYGSMPVANDERINQFNEDLAETIVALLPSYGDTALWGITNDQETYPLFANLLRKHEIYGASWNTRRAMWLSVSDSIGTIAVRSEHSAHERVLFYQTLR